MPRALKLIEISKYLLGARYIAGCAFNLYGFRSQINVDVQTIFEHAKILIPRTEKSFNVRTNRNTFLHSVLAYPPTRVSRFRFKFVRQLRWHSDQTRMPAHCEGRIKMWGLSEPTGMLADQAQAG